MIRPTFLQPAKGARGISILLRSLSIQFLRRSTICVQQQKQKEKEEEFSSKRGHRLTNRESKAVSDRSSIFPVTEPDNRRPGAWLRQMAKQSRDVDFAVYARRRIALLVTYLGQDYSGLVVQDTTENTIEQCLYSALEKSRLCQDRSRLEWSKSGRTDKGVSAFRQVFGLTVRSNLAEGEGVFWPEGVSERSPHKTYTLQELNYSRILNAHLPPTIRVLAVARLPSDRPFSARYHCSRRVYKYFMPVSTLDVRAMRDGAKLLIGEKDFRNFCRIDNSKTRLNAPYTRRINAISIQPFSGTAQEEEERVSSADGDRNPFQMLELTIDGSSFLWHQIRYIVSILIEIGLRMEKPEVINELLDIEKIPSRPAYIAASELPLCLFDCSYDQTFDLKWTFDGTSLKKTIKSFQKLYMDYQSRACMLQRMLTDLEKVAPNVYSNDGLLANCSGRSQSYVPIMRRQRCAGLEERKSAVESKIAKLESAEEKVTDHE